MGWMQSRSDGFSWAQVADDELAALVATATQSSCGITFGQTKDHGALVVTVSASPTARETKYLRAAEDVHELLSDLNSEAFKRWARDNQPV